MNINFNALSPSEKASLRVIQKNLIYITNLSPSLTVDQLSKPEFLGQYGKIKKITPRSGCQGKLASAYVIFCNENDALDCMFSISESWYGGLQLKAQFGTSKFCNHFINGKQTCQNPDCLFLHEYNPDMHMYFSNQMNKDSFLKETHPDIPANRITFDNDRKQMNGFPPSYFHVQMQQLQKKLELEKEEMRMETNVFTRCAQVFSSMPFGQDFLCLEKEKV